MQHSIIQQIQNIRFGDSKQFFIMAGPCVVESEGLVMDTAGYLSELTKEFQLPFIFKSSYRKANRSRQDSFTGIGDMAALEILGKVRKELNLPVVTDIHESSEAAMAAPVCGYTADTCFSLSPDRLIE